ncbi:MAG: metallophosphoesterase [Pirellulales bacterium]|nr:metallophosphoesterase [Pirellulales bacterium]
MIFALALYTLFGHAFLWIGLNNRLHAFAFPRCLLKLFSKVSFTLAGAGPPVLLAWWWAGGNNPFSSSDTALAAPSGRIIFACYLGACWLAGAGTIARWLWHNLYFRRPPKRLRFQHRRRRAEICPERAAAHPDECRHHFTAKLPGNQTLQLEVTHRAFVVPRLPPALDGLKILHLSDIHFTGKIGKAYFREVVRAGNDLQPDLIALTGDYADCDACIDWIPDTLGRLFARYGVYYVMGNHERYVDARRLRETMNACGLVELGGRWMQIEIRGETIVLAGNELPWFAPAADLGRCPPSSAQGGPPRIVLAHSPDQIGWARSREADLMLCGHTHGGQIRLPFAGAILAPSRHGVKFDCGLFYLPPTILHVTRGVSGKQALRWNCPPEIALLTLHAPK